MNNRRDHRKKVYNNLYMKYLGLIKKTDALQAGNRLLQCTNNEISKGIIGLKKEMRKCMSINSNLKAEIYDLTMDKKHLMDDNKGLYSTLTTLHKDTGALEKRISHLLDSLNPEIKSVSPKVNEQVMKNPKDIPPIPETNYHRYNFKDFVYIQDLSPIMEENGEVKHLIKPSDITRRLGHRAKVPNSDKCSQSAEVNGPVYDEGTETNIVCCSPSSVRMQDFDKETNRVGYESSIVEDRNKSNFGVCIAKEVIPSLIGCNKLNNMTVDGSVLSSSLSNHSESQQTTIFTNENDHESSISVSIVLSSDSENNLSENEFDSSLFANVYPRRKLINNGYSLSVGSVEEECKEEPNSINIEKENVSPIVSMNLLIDDQDQSSIRIRSDSFLKCNTTVNLENNISLASENSHQEERVKENTYSHFQHNIEDVIDTDGNTCNESNKEMYNLSESSSHGRLKSLSKLAEATVEDIEISTSSFKRTSHDSSKKSSSLDVASKSVRGKKSDINQLSRNADKNSVNSSKCPTPERKLDDSKKSLRPKKPLNFAESPIVKKKQKRKRKLVKAI